MRTLAPIFFVSILSFLSREGMAADDEFGEAAGLPDRAAETTAKDHVSSQGPRLRGYLKARYDLLDLDDTRHENGAGELAWETKVPVFAAGEVFGDFRATYTQSSRHGLLSVNQLGVRSRFGDDWILALGKERNRRSPGLMVSPSDVIHGRQPLPGMEEDRSGVWLVRASWLKQSRSVDFILLPVESLNEQGMPDDVSAKPGVVVRSFQQLENLDVQVNVGTLNDSLIFGASTQGFIENVWKVYGEAGYREEDTKLVFSRDHVWSYLAGAGYEGSDAWTARVEYYHDDAGLSDREARGVGRILANAGPSLVQKTSAGFTDSVLNPFVRQNYAVTSLSFMEIADRWNVLQSLIYDLDGFDTLSFSRLVYLVNDRNEIGFSVLNVRKESELAPAIYPFNWVASLDWKWSF